MTESGSTNMDIPDFGVTDEMVDAALDVLLDHGHSGIKCYDPQPGLDRTVRAVLQGAFPHLRPLFRHATEVGRELGRREATSEITEALEHYQHALEAAYDARMHHSDALKADAVDDCVEIVRGIASQASGASSTSTR